MYKILLVTSPCTLDNDCPLEFCTLWTKNITNPVWCLQSGDISVLNSQTLPKLDCKLEHYCEEPAKKTLFFTPRETPLGFWLKFFTIFTSNVMFHTILDRVWDNKVIFYEMYNWMTLRSNRSRHGMVTEPKIWRSHWWKKFWLLARTCNHDKQ